MNLRTPLNFAILFVAMATSLAFGDIQSAASQPDYSVKLRFGKEIVPDEPAIQTLCSNVVALLKTSNVNSRQPETSAWPEYQVSGVQEDYRNTISDKYLLVTFKEPQEIQTVSGKIVAKEIVIGFKQDNHGRNEVFTIDDEGRVVSYGKYSGSIWINLLQSVNKIIGD
jgi:hypothetical protein